MKPIPGLSDLLDRAVAHGIFGTKERSVISAANEAGIEAIVAQQFALGQEVLAKGLVPILEPEVTISIADKAEAEDMLLASILKHSRRRISRVMLKLSLPTKANLYAPLIAHPKVLRVVALSGGYSRDEANAKLAENHGMIASFSRALTEGLSAQQSDDDFNATIAATIDGIFAASIT
jgi:fructose-bisphosphate aldolase class I